MKGIKISQLEKVQTLEDLKNLEIGNIYNGITERGGGIGFYSKDVATAFHVPVEWLPRHFGAGCNYLGGGVRGAIFQSTFDKQIPELKAKRFRALAAACVRVYESVESESGIDDDADDETSCEYWNLKATKAARCAGIVSAY